MTPRSRSDGPGGELRSVPDDLARHYVEQGWWTDTSLGQMIADGLAATSASTFAVRSAERPWRGTMGDVDRAARAFATTLRSMGVGPGDVVVFQLPNWVEAAITFWGAAYVGATVVPVVHFYGPKEVGFILDVTQPAVVVTPARFGTRDFLESSAAFATDGPWRWLVVGDDDALPHAALPDGATAFATLLDADPLAAPAAVDPNDPVLVAFTSGTTRDPKGVIHTHRTIGFEAVQLDEMLPRLGPPPIVGAPVGHFMGMLMAFLVLLVRRQPVNLVDVWDPAAVLAWMRDDHLGVTGGSTYFLTSVLDHPDYTDEHLALMPWSGLGGSPIPVAVAERATRLGIRLLRAYGSTEHPSITGSYVDEPEVKRVTTDGHALPGVDLRLDEDGQILTRGPDCFIGYTDPALTATVFDADGWYHTGDIGVIDDEGYLTITDRISDIIIRGGENISAQEVEELLMGLDAVTEVSVVAEPDERLGEHATAVVRVHPGREVPSLDEIRDHLTGAGLAKQKWPEAVYGVTEFPRTASGKVQKFRLRDQLRDGTLDTIS
jgi:acyl-CoA synthetase (AMP-forming)/AMP-acid ligase II